jgi:hypothetical protein
MSVVTISDGALVIKDPSDIKAYTFDYDTENLAVGAAILTSTFTITAVWPSTTDLALTKDQETILAGARKTQVRLSAGTLGQKYQIANKIVTSESPAQTKERSFTVWVQDR